MKFCLNSFLALMFLVSAASSQDLAGQWIGIFRSSGPVGTMKIQFVKSKAEFTGDVTIAFSGREAKSPISELKLASDSFSFTGNLSGAIGKFTGILKTPKITGSFTITEGGNLTVAGVFCVSKDSSTKCTEADYPAMPNVQIKTQRADETYDTSVKTPAYITKHPKVLFDEAHNNFHKTTGNFKPFADLIRNDGYSVTPNPDPFTSERLKGFEILAIVNARGTAGQSAFTDAEIEAVAGWVQKGGSLLLIADHTPFGGFAEKLGKRLGIDMSKGYTDDPQNRDPVAKDLLFSRDNKLLGDHPITKGRNASERINRVVSFTGQSLKSDTGTVVLKLSDSAYDEFPNSEKKIPATGRAQAIAIKYGKGKIFMSGEAAMFTAQLTPQDRKFGMNVEGLDNRQYALNVVHWLSGLLK